MKEREHSISEPDGAIDVFEAGCHDIKSGGSMLWRLRLDIVWQSIKEDIEFDIIAGRYQEGQKAPSSSNIMDVYKVSSLTANKVLRALEDEGVVKKTRGARGRTINPRAKRMLIDKHMYTLRRRVVDIAEVAFRCGIPKETIIKYFVIAYEKRQ